MKYKIVVDKQNRTNPTSEKREYEVDIEELRAKGNIYDSLMFKIDATYVIRRLKISEYQGITILDEPIKEPLENVNIELFEGDNYIYLIDMEGNRFYAEYLIRNEFNEVFATRKEMNSAINLTIQEIDLAVNQKLTNYSTTEEMNSAINIKANEIKSSVSETYTTKEETNTAKQEAIDSANNTTNEKLKDYSTTLQMNSTITQTAESINSEVSKKVGNDEIISKINQSAEKIQINGDKIDISGKAVNFKTNINETIGPYTEEDRQRLINIIVGNITATDEDYEKYDLDGNNKLNSADTTIMARAIKYNNGYVEGKGTFEINPYSMKRSVALYNENDGKYSAVLSLLGSTFKNISTERIEFLNGAGISNSSLALKDDTGTINMNINSSLNNINGQYFSITNIESNSFDSNSHINMFALENGKAIISLQGDSYPYETEITNEGMICKEYKVRNAGTVMYGVSEGHSYRCNWEGDSRLHFYVDATDVGNVSDKRLKTDIREVDKDLIKAIGELDYKQFKKDNRNGLVSVGIIAQDLIEILNKYGKNAKDYELLEEFQYKLDDETLYYRIDYEQFLLLRMMAKEQEIKKLQKKDKQKDNLIQSLIERIEKLEAK